MHAMQGSVHRTFAVAQETFRQTARDRTSAVLVGLALAAMMTSVVLAPLALGEAPRVVADTGLVVVVLTCLAVLTTSSASLLTREIDRKTLLHVLSTPVRRREYVLGRAAGLFATGTLVATVLCTVHLALLAAMTGTIWWSLVGANLLALAEVAVLVAVLSVFSAFSTPGLTACLTVGVFVIGHGSADLLAAVGRLTPAAQWTARALYIALPHLDMLNARAAAVHAGSVGLDQIRWGWAYAVVYASALLALATVLFERRELV